MTKILEKKIKMYKMSVLTEVLMYIFIILIFIPIISRKVPGEVVIGIYAVFILSLYFDSKERTRIYEPIIVFFVMFLIYFIVRYYTTNKMFISNLGNVGVYIMLAMSVFPLYFFFYVAKFSDIKKFIFTIYWCIFFTTITSFISLCMDLENSKIVTGMGPNTIVYLYHNVCDYLYSYVIGLMGVISLYIYRQKRMQKTANSVFWLISAMFMIIVTIMASSMISILCVMLVLFVYLLFSIRNKKVRQCTFLILGTLLILFLIIFIIDKSIFYKFFKSLAESINIGNISIRLLELNESIFGNSEFSFSGRTELWQASLNSILSSPLFGVGFLVGRKYISAHSQILDDIAKIGFLGYIFIIVVFLIVVKLMKKVKKTNANVLFWAAISGTILFSFMNLSNSIPLVFVVFVVIPILARIENTRGVILKNKAMEYKRNLEHVQTELILNKSIDNCANNSDKISEDKQCNNLTEESENNVDHIYTDIQ